MFWKHFTPPVSELDNLLAKEDCTLTEVLDAEDVLQECKGINNKLLKFLTRQDNIEELVSLVTSEPLDDLDETERFKHPNTACNILTSGAGALMDKLIGEAPLLDKLFEFMQNERPLNSLLASFFSRVVVELFGKKPSHMLEYVTSKESLFDIILSHIDTSAIMDLVLGVCGAFQSVEERQDLCQWLAEHCVVNKLVDMISANTNGEKQRNAARILTELHRTGYEFLSMNYESMTQDDLVTSLESDELITRLLTNVLSDSTSSAPFCHGLDFLCSMVNQQRSGTQTGGILAETIQYPNITNEEAASRVAKCTVPFLAELSSVLSSPPHFEPLRASVGQMEAPLGAARLAVIRLLTMLLTVGCVEYEEQFAQHNVAGALLDLFFAYHWNNFLHSYVQQFVAFALSLQPQAGVELRRSLVANGRLLQRLAAAAMENERDQVAKQRRRGYMGHIVEMSNCVVNMQGSLEDLKERLEEINSEELEEWQDWLEGPLEIVNAKNVMVLGGTIPIGPFDSNSDPEIPIETPEQPQATPDAVTYYNNQSMATEFADRFGFDDEDFTEFEDSENALYQHGNNVNFGTESNQDDANATLFEQACSERMHRYSSDEDSDDESSGGHFLGQDQWIEKVPAMIPEAIPNADVDSTSSSDSEGGSEQPGIAEAGDLSLSTTYSVESNSSYDEEEDETSAPPVIIQQNTPQQRVNADSLERDDSEDSDLIIDIEQPNTFTVEFNSQGMETSASSNVWGGAAEESGSPLTGWANFSAFNDTSATQPSDSAPLVAEHATVGEATPAAFTVSAGEMDERGSSSGGEVSSTDSSDDSDERDGSYSFGHLSAGSDDDEASADSSHDDAEPELKSVVPLDGDVGDATTDPSLPPSSCAEPSSKSTAMETAESSADSSNGDVASASQVSPQHDEAD